MQDIGKIVVSAGIAAADTQSRRGLGIAPAERRRAVAAALVAGDLLVATITVGLLYLGAFLLGVGIALSSFVLLVIWSAILCTSLAGFGLYSSEHAEPVDRLRQRTLSNLAATVTMMAVLAAGQQALPWSIVVAGTGLMVLLGFYVDALIRGWLLRNAFWSASTVLFGTAPDCSQLARTLLLRPELGLRPVAVLLNEDSISERTHIAGLPLISPDQADVASSQIEVALCASVDLDPKKLNWLSRLPLRQIFVVHDTAVLQSLHLRTRSMGELLGVELRSAIHVPLNLRLKRLMDLAVALPAALLALPVIGLLAVAIKWSDGGAIFYAQQRVGQNGRIFQVFKLRSMYADAEQRLTAHLASDPSAEKEWERFFKLKNDPRILPMIGQFIRQFSLDELPQLWNVLRGEMSLVGPRPFPTYHCQNFDAEFQALRSSVPPGLTGLWQVTDRSNGDLTVQKQKDSFYIRNWSLWLDFYILLQTVPAMLSARGAR